MRVATALAINESRQIMSHKKPTPVSVIPNRGLPVPRNSVGSVGVTVTWLGRGDVRGDVPGDVPGERGCGQLLCAIRPAGG